MLLFSMSYQLVFNSFRGEESKGHVFTNRRTAHFIKAFADDTSIICQNANSMRAILKRYGERAKDLGLKVNAVKSVSLSVCSGVLSTDTGFELYGENIPSALNQEEDQKFLGMLLPKWGRKNSDHANYVSGKLQKQLNNIDRALLSSKSKLRIIYRYLLISSNFLLSVHDISPATVQLIDRQIDQYTKKYLGLTKSATNAFLHHPEGLNLPSLQFLYRKSKAGSIISFFENADTRVLEALRSKNERQLGWTRYQKWFCEIVQVVEEEGPIRMDTVSGVKKRVTEHFRAEEAKKAEEKLSQLEVQSSFFFWTQENAVDTKMIQAWLWGLPQHLMQFAVKARVDVLPTAANLRRWNVKSSGKCLLCEGYETLWHALNFCPIALSQDRFTWRHDNVLLHLKQRMAQKLDFGCWDMFSDLGANKNQATIPNFILPTGTLQRPDLVFVNERERRVVIMELTVPFEEGTEKAHSLKVKKYSEDDGKEKSLVSKIIDNGFECELVCLEIGSRGSVTKQNRKRLSSLFQLTGHRITKKELTGLCKSLCRVALHSSYVIFCKRKSKDWLVSAPILVAF